MNVIVFRGGCRTLFLYWELSKGNQNCLLKIKTKLLSPRIYTVGKKVVVC